MVRPSSQPPCQAVLRHLVLQPAPAGPPEPQAHNSACHCSMLNTLLQALQVKSFTRVRRMTLCDAQLARQAEQTGHLFASRNLTTSVTEPRSPSFLHAGNHARGFRSRGFHVNDFHSSSQLEIEPCLKCHSQNFKLIKSLQAHICMRDLQIQAAAGNNIKNHVKTEKTLQQCP